MSCCFGGNEVHDEKMSLRNSKEHRGRCTDCLCFVIFVIFLSGMAIITVLTVLDNGFNRVINGYDSYGNVCNDDNADFNPRNSSHQRYDTTGLKYVFYFNYTDPISTEKICVKSCPDINIQNVGEFMTYTLHKNESLCKYGVKPGEYDSRLCPTLPIIKTDPVLNRCVPDIQQLVINGIIDTKYGEFLQDKINSNTENFKLALMQLYEYLPQIGILSLCSLLFTIILVFLLRFIASLVIHLIILIASLGTITVSTYLWVKFAEIRQASLISYSTIPLIGITIQTSTAFMIYASAMTLFTLFLLLVVVTMRKRIGLVIKLICEAQKTLTRMPLLFVFPILAFIFLFMFLIYWTATALMIYSYGEYNDDHLTLLGMAIEKSSVTKVMWLYHVIGLIWVSEFIFSAQAMVISGSVAKWYFTRDKKTLSAPICESLRRLLVFHMGSVAFGSFVITLIRLPRYILIAIQNKIKTAGPDSLIGTALKACTCCLWCLENCVQYINQNAYTIIAIEGVSFCTATRKSFQLIIKNVLRVAMINSIGDFLLFVCKIAVTAISVCLAIFWLNTTEHIESLKISILPLVIVGVISFLIAHCFFTVYEMVIDALMICFYEDIEANDGSVERPYYMNKSLKEFVDETEKTNIIINKD